LLKMDRLESEQHAYARLYRAQVLSLIYVS